MSLISIAAYSVMLTDMYYLFFLIAGQPDVDMCECTIYNTLYSTAFIKIAITQLCKHMMSQFDDRLIISYGETMTGLKKKI